MPHKKLKLTESFIKNYEKKNALPAKGRVEIGDTNMPGLSLRITATGNKSFAIRRQVDGKRQQKVLGQWPVMTLEEARLEAKKVLFDVDSGTDLNEAEQAQVNGEITLGRALDDYLNHRHKSPKPLKPKTETQYRDLLRLYSSDFVKRSLLNISEQDVADRHQQITEGKILGQRKSSPAQADLWARVLRAVINFAIREYRGLSGEQLFQGITGSLSHNRQWNHVPRKQSHIRKSQLAQVLDGFDSYRASRSDYPMGIVCIDALEFAIFTGLRRGEIMGLSWNRVNLSAGYFWIDKTKNGSPLELPITDTVKQILTRRHKAKVGDYVFSPKDVIIDDPRKAMRSITKAIGLSFGFHDCRRTFASNAEASGIGSYTIKRLLNHKTNRDDVPAGYVVQSADELIIPAAKVEREVLESAGRIESSSNMDNKLMNLLGSLSDDEKRQMMFELLSSNKVAKTG